MAERKDGQLKVLMEAFTKNIDAHTEATELTAESMEMIASELMRFRAWEALLYLFFARYYSGMNNPITAATWDRDFFVQRYKELQSEDGAQIVEGIFKAIISMIEAGQEHKASLGPEVDDTPVM
jgi:hypothetical protein